MPLISSPIPNFINGVSQQPFALRLAAQAEMQENGHSSVVEGLTKRPNTHHVAKLSSTDFSSAYVHMINRDVTERYIVVVTNGAVRVFGFDGVERTVNLGSGVDWSYLTVTSASTEFSAVTIADYTFVVNKTITAAMAATVKTARAPEAIIWIRQGNYSTDYSVTLSGAAAHTATYTTPASDATQIQTDHIAQQLVNGINGSAGYSATRFGSTVHIFRADEADFNIAVEDSFGDLATRVVKGKTQTFDDLPDKAPNGFQVEITGSPNNAFDNYYVEYETDTDGAEGIWREIPAPGRQISFDAATMPHTLVREADGTFTFGRPEWNDCVAGDAETAEDPSFITKKIQDVFFYRNRLGFIADENVIFSRAGDFFHFWRETMTDILDTDPIDIAVSHVKVSILRHTLPFNESLLLFSDQTQFTIGGNDLLTPATASIDQTTEFETNLRARPVGAGRYVYFVTPKGGFSTIREYFTTDNDQGNDAQDVTSHVPKYLTGDVFKLAVSTNENLMVALTDQEPRTVFIYQYFFDDTDQKVQSAWHKWVFDNGETVLNADFIQSTLWLVIQRSDGLYLDRMDIEPGQQDTGLYYKVLLDRRVSSSDCVLSYNPNTQLTTVTLPYPDDGDIQFVGDGTVSTIKAGYILPATRVNSTQLTLKGDRSTGGFFVGRRYTLKYQLSPLIVREQAPGGGLVANTEGRLQLRRMAINYADTGYFKVKVTPFRRNTYERVFSGRIVGSARSPLGSPGLETGTFRFPIMANNLNVDIVIENDSPLPCRILNADWEAQYVIRSVRTG